MLLFCTKRVLHGTLPWVHYLNAVTGIKVLHNMPWLTGVVNLEVWVKEVL